MKPVTKRSALLVRIIKLNAKSPRRPLRGLGNVRCELELPHIFRNVFQKHCPNHCDIVTSREAVNRFGKLGFVGQDYVSPELLEVIHVNNSDFVELETAYRTLASFKL